MIQVKGKLKEQRYNGQSWNFKFHGLEAFSDNRKVKFLLTDSNDVLITLHNIIEFNEFESIKLEVTE